MISGWVQKVTEHRGTIQCCEFYFTFYSSFLFISILFFMDVLWGIESLAYVSAEIEIGMLGKIDDGRFMAVGLHFDDDFVVIRQLGKKKTEKLCDKKTTRPGIKTNGTRSPTKYLLDTPLPPPVPQDNLPCQRGWHGANVGPQHHFRPLSDQPSRFPSKRTSRLSRHLENKKHILPINQSIDQSINQSRDQSINQAYCISSNQAIDRNNTGLVHSENYFAYLVETMQAAMQMHVSRICR